METIILKFGGSSVADNVKLNIVAEKIINFHKKNNRIVVVVSAQGKKTDNLLNEALNLDKVPNDRELDVLLSTGELQTASKLSILLNSLGYKSISLSGWQAGIITNNVNQNAIIERINTTRINNELNKNKIVIIAGFQGINNNFDVTTLGRGGSDTTAVALAVALQVKKCYIFSDVDGVYSADPKMIETCKKLNQISYNEMLNMSNQGAKVLHNRCIEIAKKFEIDIIAKSTFNNNKGSIISKNIEESGVKGIVLNDKLLIFNIKSEIYSINLFFEILNKVFNENIFPIIVNNNSRFNLNIDFIIRKEDLNKLIKLIENEFDYLEYSSRKAYKISFIGSGIVNDNSIIKKIINILIKNKIKVLKISINYEEISLILKDEIDRKIVKNIHDILINKKAVN